MLGDHRRWQPSFDWSEEVAHFLLPIMPVACPYLALGFSLPFKVKATPTQHQAPSRLAAIPADSDDPPEAAESRRTNHNPRQSTIDTRGAEILARKADLLARSTNQRADEWAREHADQTRQLAHDARVLATQDRAINAPEHDPTHSHWSSSLVRRACVDGRLGSSFVGR
jgi:hypothetical protein